MEPLSKHSHAPTQSMNPSKSGTRSVSKENQPIKVTDCRENLENCEMDAKFNLKNKKGPSIHESNLTNSQQSVSATKGKSDHDLLIGLGPTAETVKHRPETLRQEKTSDKSESSEWMKSHGLHFQEMSRDSNSNQVGLYLSPSPFYPSPLQPHSTFGSMLREGGFSRVSRDIAPFQSLEGADQLIGTQPSKFISRSFQTPSLPASIFTSNQRSTVVLQGGPESFSNLKSREESKLQESEANYQPSKCEKGDLTMPRFDRALNYSDMCLKIYLDNAALLTQLDASICERNDCLKMVKLMSTSQGPKQFHNDSSSHEESLSNHSSPDEQSENASSEHHQRESSINGDQRNSLSQGTADHHGMAQTERYYSGRKKHNRRCAYEIPKSFICPFDNCFKLYGSEGSLNLHMKIKHNAGSKTEREKIAKQMAYAISKGSQVSLPTKIALPPGIIEKTAMQLGLSQEAFSASVSKKLTYASGEVKTKDKENHSANIISIGRKNTK